MKTLLLFLSFIALPSLVFGADWHRNFEDAQREARRRDQHLLVYFTADWCGNCKRLNREALDTKKFRNYADKKLVLFKADFSDRGRRPGRWGVQNHRLSERFRVTGYPTMIVLRPNGSLAGEVKYRKGGADEVLRQIDKARDNREKGGGRHHQKSSRGHRR